MPSPTAELPLEIWFQILNQAMNLLLPMATTPRLYSTYILPLLLTSHTFHERCHPVTYPHLRKHKLLQLFTRWKAAHSREVHFYHHPLRTSIRYALPDRVGNPPGEEYETLYSFIKRAYLFGCESVCGTVIPVEGGLEAPVMAPSAPAAQAPPAGGVAEQVPGNDNNNNNGGAANAAAATTNSTPASTTGTGANAGNVVVAPPPAQATAPVVTHQGVDGGGQGWKSHALQWHVANPTFAAEGTIELYREIVEEYRRVICGSAAAKERNREIERVMDMMKNPHRYAELSTTEFQSSSSSSSTCSLQQQEEQSDVGQLEQIRQVEELEENDEVDEADIEEDEEDEEDIECDMIEQDENELLSEIEAKGGLRRRDSGHGQSSSEMDIDEDMNEVDEDDMMSVDHREPVLDQQLQQQQQQELEQQKMESTPVELGRSRSAKREPESMSTDILMEGSSRHRRGLRHRMLERSSSASEQERLIMDMALDKPCQPKASLAPFHSLETKTLSPSSSSSSPSYSGFGLARSGSPAPFTPLMSSSRKTREAGGTYNRSKSSRSSLQRSHSSPGTMAASRSSLSSSSYNRSQLSSARSFDHSSSSSSSSCSSKAPTRTNTRPMETTPTDLSANTSTSSASPLTPTSPSSVPALKAPIKAEDLDFDLASACANTFASDLAFVLARVPGLGAHFHRFEQLAKLKLHVGWAKHAQSRGGNDVFVMSCSRLISLLAPLANTPLVSERGG